MTSFYSNKRQSLVERKKEQWAKEREELDNLTTSTWGINPSFNRFSSKTNLRTKYQSNTSIEMRNSEETTLKRRPSLPPIYSDSTNISTCSYLKMEQEICAETSGYGSDSANQSTPEYFSPQDNGDAESISSNRSDERQKWIDSTIKIRHVWDPLHQQQQEDAPGWLRRGLQRNSEILVSTRSPDTEGTEVDGNETRPYTSSSSSYRTHIRGQNIPLEPIELAERERKRQIALDHQNAIKAQLEERESRRKEERERRLKEEAEEELRIRREQEIEDQRLQQEAQRKREKQEIERKRNEAMREALEIAEREAKMEKCKLKKQATHKEDMPRTEDEETSNAHSNANSNTASKNVTPREIKRMIENPILEEEIKQSDETEAISVNLISSNSEHNATEEVTNTGTQDVNFTAITTAQGIENYPNLQFAMIVPPLNLGPSIPIAVPVLLSTDRLNGTLERTENRVLTPSMFRVKVQFCDSSTQTDFPEPKPRSSSPEKSIVEKLEKLEVVQCTEPVKKDRKQQTEETKSKESLEDRPKWGVNRPPTRYVKQSEKDPLYQRRKLRQKSRQPKIKRYSPHSSDDSAFSPRPSQNSEYSVKRKSRGLWRKHDQKIPSKLGMYQTEIVALESDKDQIYRKTNSSGCRNFYERSYTDQDNEINILTIKHPASSHNCSERGSRDEMKILEELQRLKNGLTLKQEQWDKFPLESVTHPNSPKLEVK